MRKGTDNVHSQLDENFLHLGVAIVTLLDLGCLISASVACPRRSQLPKTAWIEVNA